jgi:hypothetical protein
MTNSFLSSDGGGLFTLPAPDDIPSTTGKVDKFIFSSVMELSKIHLKIPPTRVERFTGF